MILSSFSRDSISFKQLITDYLTKKDFTARFTWNMYSSSSDNKELVKEFKENAKHIKTSRWKIYLYHEVISLSPNNLSEEKNTQILHDLASKYIEKRANNHLVFWVIHNDTPNPHIHLVISSNEIEAIKRKRLDTSSFNTLRAELEAYKNEKYTELEFTHNYQEFTKEKVKSSSKEQAIKHKRKKQTKKELVAEDLKQIFTRSLSLKALDNALKNSWYEFYQNGSTIWVKFEDKKYRFKTLWVLKEYTQTLTKIKKRELRQEKRSDFKKSKNKTKRITKEL